MKNIITLFFLCSIVLPSVSSAADLNAEMAKLKRMVSVLQKEVNAEKAKNASLRDMHNRVARLEKLQIPSTGKKSAASSGRANTQAGFADVKKIMIRLKSVEGRVASLETKNQSNQNSMSNQQLENIISAFDIKAGSITFLKDIKIPTNVSVNIKSSSFKVETPVFKVKSPVSEFELIKSKSVITDVVSAKNITPANGNLF